MNENQVLAMTGLTRERLRQMRKGYSTNGYDYPPRLVFRRDYDYDEDGNRLYTESGIEKIKQKTPTK